VGEAPTPQEAPMPVQFGIDRFLQDDAPVRQRARVAMVTNDTARLASDSNITSRVALREAGFKLVRLFGPEHGLSAAAADGAHVADGVDPLTKVPVVSLYGSKFRPSPDELRDIDAVIYDIPDVGARFYTYIWTLSHVLEACAEAGKPLVVLDRPNPLGGDLRAAEGPMLDEAKFSTFVGRWNVPIRYSLTIGELATLWNSERKIGAELRVVTCSGWTRDMQWPDTQLPFVPPSPAIKDFETAVIYPGTCLVEGTNLSEGRGTDAPFRLIGAPWIDGAELAARLNSLELPGIAAMPAEFVPSSRKHAGARCGGVRLTVTDARALRPVSGGLHLIAAAIAVNREKFEWNASHFDRLLGRGDVRARLEALLAHAPVSEWTGTGNWESRAGEHLLYE
jgi:uncharacterized protein YbbC (DUF1343 family)